MDAIITLSDVPLFSGLGPAERALIGRHVRRQCFRADKTVLQRDDPGIALYVILSGQVKVHNEAADGQEVLIAVLSAGGLFGELSLFDGKGRSADVTTLEPTELLVLPREALLECIRQSPQVAINLLATLAGRMRLANEIIQAFITLDAPGRMAKQLLVLARDHGVKTPTGVEIRLPLTRGELAGLIGVTRETGARILSEFRSLGWVETDRQHGITLLREDCLTRRCDG
jgi:CRP/FNR family transcriptional regulator, cyclic AMP receptor protein